MNRVSSALFQPEELDYRLGRSKSAFRVKVFFRLVETRAESRD